MATLTAEDKIIFACEIKKANPIEVLTVARFIEGVSLTPKDKKYCNSHIGRRCEQLLKNVIKNQSWE